MSAPVPRACVPARCLFLFPRPARSLTLSLTHTTVAGCDHLLSCHTLGPLSHGMAAQRTERTKRTKTFTGCWTCRERKVKCDEAEPHCQQCRRRGWACGVTAHGCSGWPLRFHILFVSPIQTLLLLPLPPWRKGPPVCCGECFHRVMQHSSRPTYTIMF